MYGVDKQGNPIITSIGTLIQRIFNNEVNTVRVDQTAMSAVAIVPDNSNDLPKITRAIYVGVAGDVSVQMADGSAVVFKALAVGRHELGIKRVLVTSTTATNMLALY